VRRFYVQARLESFYYTLVRTKAYLRVTGKLQAVLYWSVQLKLQTSQHCVYTIETSSASSRSTFSLLNRSFIPAMALQSSRMCCGARVAALRPVLACPRPACKVWK
jgi:hypothetical protein